MKRLTLIACLAAAASIAGCSTQSSDGKAAPALLTADASTTGVQHITFQAGTGEAIIGTSSDDQLHVQLDLRQDERGFLGVFHWMSEDTTRDLKGASVKLQRHGDGVEISLVYPSGDSHSDVKQEWTVTLPPRLALQAHMQAGRMAIKGMAGGIDASLGAGDLTIHSAAGPIRGDVRAGRLHVVSDSTQPGAISLRSMFGLAVLDLQGTYYGPPEKQSGFKFFGNDVNHAAGGKDDMDLHVTAGLVDLRVGPQGDEKEYRKIFSDDDKD
ncbi:MAG TPA: hypothetical protein VGH91_07550 [Gammaproteobacteria bacterium]